MTEYSDEQADSEERDELDATGEFFSVGTPLHAVRAGYIRRAADDVLFETLLAGRYAHVIAPYRSGKSSLIAATAARLESQGVKVATLDLAQIGDRDAGSDPGRWYYNVAYRLLRQLRIRADLQSWWQDKAILSNRQRLLEFYTEIVLQNVSEQVVIFVDEVQYIETQDFGDQLLASIRAAHNARATDPEFSRLTFALLGECDPISLLSEPELSPFHITQACALEDFTRDELELFRSELNLPERAAGAALERIYYWTSGQPYLTQKLARAISRERPEEDIAGHVDRIVSQQLTGRNALHNEPHLSHIHREVANDSKRKDKLLNLYGRIRKGVAVPTDLGSSLQRRLIAIGLLVIDDDSHLTPRNRVYAAVFTARWANENLPNNWRIPALVCLAIAAFMAVPFWYTQLLPISYVDTLTSDATELATAREAYINFNSFPGHTEAARNLYRNYLERRARAAPDAAAVVEVAALANDLADAGRLADQLVADYWDRQASLAMRLERRDDALLATLESLILSTPLRRARAAALLDDDYQQLLASLPAAGRGDMVFNPGSMLLTETRSAQVSQWSLGTQGLQKRDDWTMTALEISPLVRRVIVDREGQVARLGLSLTLSHARVPDLRIKVIAPSGRTVEVAAGVTQAFANDAIRIPAAQLRELVGETLSGTWSLSIRDEEIGVAGHLVGWNLQLNSQGLVEDFQRGLNIPDPVERETDNIWFSADGRFAVARAMQSDSARIWDLAFAKPVRAVAVSEVERLIGLSTGARLLATAGQDSVNLWDTQTGGRVASLPVGVTSPETRLTADGGSLFIQKRSETETRFELWSLTETALAAELEIAGTPALVAIDGRGRRLATADFDRAVRVWDLESGELIAQIDVSAQPSGIDLSFSGDVLGVIYGDAGAALWRIDSPTSPIVAEAGPGRWQLRFSPSGTRALIGRPGFGFQVFDSRDGLRLGTRLGTGSAPGTPSLLGFSTDEQVLVTGGAGSIARFWRAPAMAARADEIGDSRPALLWPPPGDVPVAATPDAGRIVIGDRQGDVHVLPAAGSREALAGESERVSFIGHSSPVRLLRVSANGARIASVAADNSLRIWATETGLPVPFFAAVTGNSPEQLVFSEDASLLGILSSNRAHIMDTATGEFLARFELLQPHHGIAFAGSNALYLGNENGELRFVFRQPDGSWTIQTVWRDDAAIRWLAAAPSGDELVLVDQNNLARKFSLSDGRVSATTLQLPSVVQEVTFAPSGSRLLLRTPRYVHRANSASSGLIWLDAALAPAGLNGARLVFGDARTDDAAALAHRVFLPAAGDAAVRLQPVVFTDLPGPGLFGTREALLAEWRERLGRNAPPPAAD